METFDNFMLHKVDTNYNTTGFSVELGGGYSFATDGKSPIIRELVLYFTGYKWYLNEDGSIDTETNKNINNMGALRDFFFEHKTHKEFIYNHPADGEVVVRFKEALKIPKAKPDSGGIVEDFQVTLIEML